MAREETQTHQHIHTQTDRLTDSFLGWQAYVAQCLSDFLETAVPDSLPGNFNAEVSE